MWLPTPPSDGCFRHILRGGRLVQRLLAEMDGTQLESSYSLTFTSSNQQGPRYQGDTQTDPHCAAIRSDPKFVGCCEGSALPRSFTHRSPSTQSLKATLLSACDLNHTHGVLFPIPFARGTLDDNRFQLCADRILNPQCASRLQPGEWAEHGFFGEKSACSVLQMVCDALETVAFLVHFHLPTSYKQCEATTLAWLLVAGPPTLRSFVECQQCTFLRRP